MWRFTAIQLTASEGGTGCPGMRAQLLSGTRDRALCLQQQPGTELVVGMMKLLFGAVIDQLFLQVSAQSCGKKISRAAACLCALLLEITSFRARLSQTHAVDHAASQQPCRPEGS